MYRPYLTRDRLAFVASVVASARACQDSVPFVSRWYAVPASTMGEALYTTRSRVLNRNDTLQRAPDASRTPGLCAAARHSVRRVAGALRVSRHSRHAASKFGQCPRSPGRPTRPPLAHGPWPTGTPVLASAAAPARPQWSAACRLMRIAARRAAPPGRVPPRPRTAGRVIGSSHPPGAGRKGIDRSSTGGKRDGGGLHICL